MQVHSVGECSLSKLLCSNVEGESVSRVKELEGVVFIVQQTTQCFKRLQTFWNVVLFAKNFIQQRQEDAEE